MRAFACVVIAFLLAALVVATAPAAPAGATLGAPLTRLYFDSEPNDWVGAGEQLTLNTIVAGARGPGGITFASSEVGHSFQAWFAPPLGVAQLTPGTYENAQRMDFRDTGRPGLDVFGDGRGCNTLTGRFIVDEINLGADGVPTVFSARFEQHCEGADQALFGSVSYNSTADFRSISYSRQRLDFGSVLAPMSSETSQTITNLGPSLLNVSRVAIEGPDATQFSVSGHTCTNVASGQSCAIDVRFTPTGTPGVRNAELIVFDDVAPESGSGRDFAMSGTATGLTTLNNASNVTFTGITATSATVSWSAPAANPGGEIPTGYLVHVLGVGAPADQTTTTTSAALNGLTANSPYSVSVTALYSQPNPVAIAPTANFSTTSGVPGQATTTQSIFATKFTPGGLIVQQKCGVFGALPAVDDPDLGVLVALPGAIRFADPSLQCGVDLGTTTLLNTGPRRGQFYGATGRINQIEVIDARPGNQAWTVSALISPFTNGGITPNDTFSSNLLGWRPHVTAANDPAGLFDRNVLPGPGIEPSADPAPGQPRTLASALPGKTATFAQLDARLKLLIPATANNGRYSATITFTII